MVAAMVAYSAHARRYPVVKTQAEAVATPRALRWPATVAKRSIIGAAEGTIIATIITIHIGINQTRAGPLPGIGIGIAWSGDMLLPM